MLTFRLKRVKEKEQLSTVRAGLRHFSVTFHNTFVIFLSLFVRRNEGKTQREAAYSL